MNTKKILQQLKDVFIEADVEEVQLEENTEEIVEATKEVLETEVEIEAEEVALAEEEITPASEEESKVEYATRVELLEIQKQIMDILEKMQKGAEDKKDVPEDLSSQKEVELAEEVEEISHSPETEVEKKVHFSVPKANPNTIKSRIYNQLFN